MKKNYFFIFILTMSFSVISFAQTQPTVHNSTFDKIAKAEGSDCSCAGWINKSLADQGESSTTDGNDVVKLDNVESDGVYQEVAVEANSDYTIDLDVKWSSTDTTTEYLEIVVLKGSGYVADYTPAYAGPAEAAQDDFGYRTVESADLASNQLSKSNLTVPGDSEMNAISTISFNTGTETSIAIFIRAVGPYDSGAHGDSGKDKGWMNGDTELRIDNFSLVNLGESSTTSNLFIAETFDYDDATPLVSTEGWANFSGTEGQILVNSGEIQLKDTDSEDADTIFPDGSVTGDVYYAFDITVTKPASVSGSDFEYFALLRPVGSTSYKARLDVAEFTETGFKFGIHSSSSTAEVLWGSELSYTETHRIVVRYSTTVGDTQLWVNASDDSSSSITTTTTSTVADIGAFAFRQSSSSPDFIHTIDNLAVGSAFDDVLNFPTTSTTPSIAITAPTDGATLESTTTSVTVSVSTTDFAVGATDAGLDGHIHWSIQENSDAAVDQAMKYDTNDETISVTSGNTYTVFMELRDNSHQPLSPEVNTSVTFSVEAGSNTVTPLTSATWKGYINTFNISDGAYQFGFEYGVADMQSTITDTYVKLQPNFGIWTAEASNAAWFDSSSGTQTPILNIEGNTFVENNDLAGSDLTFEGNVSAADLDAGYTAVAFIKALDPNNGYATVVNKSIDITSAGDFTVSATAAELVEGFIVQYGFAVTGPPADPATEDSLGSVVMGVEPAGSNTVTPLTSATWKGYINTFNISDGAYQFGFEYGVADMQSTITDTYVKLQPNFGIWTAEASNAAWFDSSSGTQTPILNIEGNTFVENNDLAGSDLTFEGNVSAADLDAGYTAVAFIKALDPNNGYATVVNKSIDITSAGDFTVSATAAELVEGFIVQYGFAVTGPPADPATEDSLGSVVMGDESTAGIDDQDLITLNMYPNPASDVLNISAQNTINTVEIYNVLGQKVIRMNVEDTSAEINVSNLNAGIYLIKYEINNRTSTKKFVKN
ncbi:T9SS type A sorting domain-containing protein [Polaribacter sp.]|nr:T9SS type A sorting domain-containing protein [Polaribacter sp.]